jgi:hypothetical protein
MKFITNTDYKIAKAFMNYVYNAYFAERIPPYTQTSNDVWGAEVIRVIHRDGEYKQEPAQRLETWKIPFKLMYIEQHMEQAAERLCADILRFEQDKIKQFKRRYGEDKVPVCYQLSDWSLLCNGDMPYISDFTHELIYVKYAKLLPKLKEEI